MKRIVGCFVTLFTTSNFLLAQIASTDPHDSTVLANFNVEIQKYGWPSLWDETKYVAQWGVASFDGPQPYHISGLNLNAEVLTPSFTADNLPPCINILKDIPTLKSLGINLGISYLPPEIGELSNITTLGLAHNKLDELPEELSNLTNLEVLLLTGNQFSEIPDLTGLTGLKYLSVSSNSFLAELPSSVFSLTNLETLNIGYTAITSIPEEIKNLANLKYLGANACKLTQLPGSIGNLKKLESLQIGYNDLTSLPAAVGGLESLVDLNLAGNKIQTLPETLSQLTKLSGIIFDNNLFTAFPSVIASIKSLTVIRGEYNRMQGSIPDELWNRTYPNRVQLWVRNNQLSGKLTIPDTRVVHTLYISDNKFVFSDLNDVYPGLKSNGAYMELSPQARIGTARTFIPESGEDVSFGIDNYSHLTSSVYTWYRSATLNGDLPEFISNQQMMQLTHFDPAKDGGVYYCRVTHPAFGNWELTSHVVRVIGTNRPPVISGNDAVIFRKGQHANLLLSATDDFTYPENLLWSVPSSTAHFLVTDNAVNGIQKELIITPTDPLWTGTDTVTVSTTDEQGNTTFKSVSVTLLSETNQPPKVAPVPVVYLKEEFFQCDSEECNPVWFWSSDIFLKAFITDDFDAINKLQITIDEVDADRFAEEEFIIYVSPYENDWMLSFVIIKASDTTFSDSFTLWVSDTEGGITPFEVIFNLPDVGNQPPSISAIPEQQIVRGEQRFPPLNLNSYVQDDYFHPSQLEWIAFPNTGLDATVKDSIAYVSPRIPDTSYVDTVTYRVRERTNVYMESSIDVIYRIVDAPEEIYLSGMVRTAEEQPLEGIILQGFPTEIKTDAFGQFNIQVNKGWSGTVTPVSGLYSFAPPSIDLENTEAGRSDLNFTARSMVTAAEHIDGSFSIYPNPGNGIFYLQWSSYNDIQDLSVLNSLGMTVPSQVTSLSAQRHRIELGTVSPGVYFLHIKTGDTMDVIKLIVTQ